MLGQLLFIGLPDSTLDHKTIKLIQKIQPGGFVLFSRNIHSIEQTRELTDQLRELSECDPFIAIDQEGGRVTRTKGLATVPPSPTEIFKHGQVREAVFSGLHIGECLQLMGINLNFAPVLDINHHPEKSNALRERTWGNHSQDIITYAGNFNRYMRKQKLLSCAKHFPSTGAGEVDPHFGLPSTSLTIEEMQREDFLPYTALMPELDAIMCCHTHFSALDPDQPGLPASLSKRVITGILRDQLGWDGLVLTDDLDMGAITQQFGLENAVCQAISAGNDMALVCHSFDAFESVFSALERLPAGIVDDAHKRIKKLKKKLPRVYPSYSKERWDRVNQQILDLRIRVLGEEGARLPLEDGTSPVDTY